MQKINSITIGADPEVFLVNEDDKIISSIPYIPGTKEEPFPISNFGHAIQTDNILAEFCVPPVSLSDAKGMYDNINFCLQEINQLPSIKEAELKTSIQAASIIEEDQLEDPLAKVFGCDPSFNAWKNGRQNVKPKSKNANLRTCGGHIHIGYDDANIDTNMRIIQALDLFLGVPSVILDKDTLRRELYGKAGEFRHKYYGVEYRVLSNFWIQDEEHVQWVFKNIKTALNFIETNEIDKETADSIQTCINTCDKDTAEYLIEIFNINTEIYTKICAE